MSSCLLQAGGLGSTGVSHSARTACTSINPSGKGTAKPGCHPEPLSVHMAELPRVDSLHRSQSETVANSTGWPISCIYIYFSFKTPTVWHWSFHFCCKFLIDDSLSGSTLL